MSHTGGNEDFTVPNQSQLNNLMEGCFVRVHDDKDYYWVEIDEVDKSGSLAGIIQAKLEGNTGSDHLNDQSRVCFTRDQVTHVGCDRFCFC